MRLALLSNVNIDLLDSFLKSDFELYKPDGYGQWVQESFLPSQGLIDFRPEAIALVLEGAALVEGLSLDLEGSAELADTLGHVERLAEHFSSVPIYVSTLDIRPWRLRPVNSSRAENRLAEQFAEGLVNLTQRLANLHIFDLAQLIVEHGRRNIYSDKMWYLGSVPFSTKGAGTVARALTARIRASEAVRKKVLILDLDNTLWGGVLGEDGPEGIQLSSSLLGAAYRDAQLRIRELSDLGVLLAVASKNDEDLVRQVLHDHPQMVLREDDFVAIMANWQDKASNIAALSETLNLGLSSFVFLDDNPVEREAVRQALPEVAVVDFPKDVSKLPALIAEIANEYFFTERVTREDVSKKEQYQTEAKRRSVKELASSMEEYLASLEIGISLREMGDDQVPRTAQLTQKTNQFNLTTVRLSPEQLLAYRSQPDNHVYVAQVSDRFGDYGLVLVLMVSIADQVATIDNLLMSCRVMGRCVEDSVVAAVEQHLSETGVSRVRGTFVSTPRNTPVQKLLDRLGYRRICESPERIEYERMIGAEAPERRPMHPVKWVR